MSYHKELSEILDLVRGGGFIQVGVLDLIKDLSPELSKEVIRRPSWARLTETGRDLSREIWMMQPLPGRKRLQARTYYPPQGGGGKGLPPQGRAPTGPIGPGPPPAPPPTPHEATFGDTTNEDNSYAVNAGYMISCKAALANSNAKMLKGTMRVRAQSTSYDYDKMEFGIYDQSSGAPHALQCRSAFVDSTTTEAWVDYPFTTNPYLNPADFWFGTCSRNDWQHLKYKEGGSTIKIYNDGNGWVDLPATWPGVHTTVSRTLSMYATYEYMA